MMAAMIRNRWAIGALILGLASLACNLPLQLVAVPTPTATATPTDSPTPTPTPTPTPIPADRLARGQEALFLGDWPAAIDAFQAARSAAPDEETAGAARLGIGATHLRAGRFPQAEAELSVFLENHPGHRQVGDGWFLRGLARELQGNIEGAIGDYGAYLQADAGKIDPYVQERIGDLLLQAERPEEAIGHFEAALASPGLTGQLPLRIKIGRAQVKAENYQAALMEFDAVHEAAADPATKATTNLLAGRALEELGQAEEAHQRYLDSVNRYPAIYDSYLGLIELVEAGVPVDGYQRGLVDYYAGAYEPALRAFNLTEPNDPSAALYYYRGLSLRELGDTGGAVADFDQVITAYPQSEQWAEAWFAKAVTQWAYAGQYSGAIATYRRFVEVAPDHGRAPEALLAAGVVAERMGDLELAAEFWLQLLEAYPRASEAYQAAFEAGIVRFRQNRYSTASDLFERAGASGAGTEDRSAALYWLGKALQAVGEPAGAQSAWQEARTADPTGYYSERAADQLDDREPFEPLGLFDFSADRETERREAEDWLRARFEIVGPEPLHELDDALATDPRMIRGETFWRLGLYGQAKAEFGSLREEAEGDAEATYRLMHKLLDLGHYQPAIFAARHILDLAGLDDASSLGAPRYFNSIRFGAYYGELILPAAAEHELDPLLLLSVVRQESLFEGFATSYAAARGLMQVIPTTGEEIANQLGWPPAYTSDDLYRPMVSVRFGSYYLARQRDLFDGNLVMGLAAYNAGPGNVLAWQELAPDDPDLFVEVMRIDQPQDYVRSIYEVYRIYQQLYATE